MRKFYNTNTPKTATDASKNAFHPQLNRKLYVRDRELI